MKKSILLLTILGLFAAGGILSGCGSASNENVNAQTGQQANHNKEGAQHAEESGAHSSESGQHNSEPSGEHHESKGHTEGVHLSEQQLDKLGVEVSKLSAGSAASTISRPATVTYDLDNIGKVGPRIEAKVVRVLKDLGDPVSAGEPLALMSSIKLGQIKADYIKLKAELKSAKARYKREKSLYKQEISSEAELLEAEAAFEEAKAKLNATKESLRLYGLSKENIRNIEAGANKPLSHFYLTSPITGIVQERNLSPGQTVSSGETPIHIVNLSEMWVMIDAYEQDIQHVKEGQTVTLSVQSIPNETFEGQIDWVSYALEEESRTLPIRAVIQNDDHQLRAGMYGMARIQTKTERHVAMMPVGAVQTIDGKSKVFVPGNKPGQFRTLNVMLGAESDAMVEIVSGLQPGDKAVTAGAFDLKSALTASTRSASHSH